MKLTLQEARNLQQRLEEIAVEIGAAAGLLLKAIDKAAVDKQVEQAAQEHAPHEPETT